MAATDVSASATPPAPPRPRRRWLWLLLASGLLVCVGVLAIEGWAAWHESLAAQALADDRMEEARRHIELALQVRSRRPATLLLAARIRRLRGSYSEAEQYLQRCGQLEGMSEPVQLEWLLLRCQRGEIDQLSPNLFTLVKQHHSDSPAILETLARVYMTQTRYLEAIVCLNFWLEQDPNAVRALDWRGWVGNQLDHREQSIRDYQRLLELQPNRSDIRLRLAQVLNASNRQPEAIPHLEQLRRELPDDPDVPAALASCLVHKDRIEEAKALLDAALKSHPGHFECLLERGRLEMTLGHPAQAEPWLRKALQVKPHNTEVLFTLYQSLQRQPDREEEADRAKALWDQDREKQQRLTSLLRKYLAANPNNVELAYEAGRLFLELGEEKHGLFWLKRALTNNDRHVPAHRTLLAYYERTNQEEKAAEERRRLAELNAE